MTESGRAAPDARVMRIASVRRETPGTRRLRLTAGAPGFSFEAGQAVLIAPAGDPRRVPYSIASSPAEADATGTLEFLIRTNAAGGWGDGFPPLRRGEQLAVEGPVGSFRLPPRVEDQRLLFIAGGTGIAPLRSMIKHVLERGYAGGIGLLYSARTPGDFAFARELRGMARRGEIDLRLTATRDAGLRWRGARGRVAEAALAGLLEPETTRCFICGPSAMVADVPPVLRALGVTADRIHLEQWR